MGAGFWSGFGEEVVSSINKREDFIREQTQRRQDYLRSVGVPAIQERNRQMKADMNLITSGVNLGLTQEVASAAYEAGHLETILDNIQNASNATGAANFYNTKQNLTQDYINKAADPDEVVRRAWGADNQETEDLGTEDGRQNSFFRTLFALDPEEAIKRGVAQGSISGYTEADAASAVTSQKTLSRPSGYVYENLPSALQSGGKAYTTATTIQSMTKSAIKTLADITATAYDVVNEKITISGNTAGLINNAASESANFVAEWEDAGSPATSAFSLLKTLQDKYLVVDHTIEPDWENFQKAVMALRSAATTYGSTGIDIEDINEILNDFPPQKNLKPGHEPLVEGEETPPTTPNGVPFGSGVPILD